MTITKVTLWKNKKSDLFAPATPDYVTTLENKIFELKNYTDHKVRGVE